jgi:DNA repair exonuclease SbcCD ATPase subunit
MSLTSAPSNRAQELYYRFLCRVAASSCRHVVVIAGNHDSPSFLNAPKELLKALDVHVIGSYQAGEIRSAKNLSGGESFIVSLSLALGLSHMASKNVRIDSLFLDEGFGTLDEEALDTALETLASLRQDGKVIGLISHVPALKERISAQIQVTPQTGGRSRISGPGCGRIGSV